MANRSPIHPSVRAQFVAFSAPLEGVIPWMYLDVKRLVTTAIGVLIDPLPLALALPWRRVDGSAATPDEIRADWLRVKERPELAAQGAGAAGRVAQLRLSAADVERVTLAKLDQMAAALVRDFPDFPSWPPDAQLATLSLVWAVGTALPQNWPRLTAALRAQDWDRAASECRIREEGNPGVAPRNVKNVALYRRAAAGATSAPPSPPPAPSLDLATVAGVQAALARLGYDPGPVDGIDGARTRAAVVAFQRASGLAADGVVGPRTRAALATALGVAP